MTLTTDRMTEIMVADTTGKPTNAKGKEEKGFLDAFHKEFSLAEKEGQIIDIPSEWEVDNEVV